MFLSLTIFLLKYITKRIYEWMWVLSQSLPVNFIAGHFRSFSNHFPTINYFRHEFITFVLHLLFLVCIYYLRCAVIRSRFKFTDYKKRKSLKKRVLLEKLFSLFIIPVDSNHHLQPFLLMISYIKMRFPTIK